MSAYAWFESGQVDLYLGDDPPNVIVEALTHYHLSLLRARSYERKKRRNK